MHPFTGGCLCCDARRSRTRTTTRTRTIGEAEDGNPRLRGIVCIKAIDQSGQHCYNTRDHFRYRVPPSFFPSPIVLVLVVVLVLGLWLEGAQREDRE